MSKKKLLNTIKTNGEFKKNKLTKNGKKTKLPFYEYVRWLFKFNAEQPKHKKLTDAQLAKTLATEFANHPELKKRFDAKNPKAHDEIRTLRGWYNQGKVVIRMGPPEVKHYSFEYDEKGFIIDPVYKDPTPMAAKKIKLKQDRAVKKREKWEAKKQKRLEEQSKLINE